ncbi:hypothetical protein AMTRI_Chr07g77080 [Amborella trichopoda]
MSAPPDLNLGGGASGTLPGAEPPQPAAHLRLHPRKTRQAAHRFSGLDCTSLPNLWFHILSFPEFPNLPPDPESPNKFPGHLQPVFDATEQLLGPLTTLVCELAGSHRRVVVVDDILMFVAAHAAAECPNSESYSYRCISACSAPVVPGLSPPILRGFINESFMDFLPRTVRFQHLDRGLLFNTSKPLKAKPHKFLECLQWLDKQAMQSVVYVAFGTIVSMSAVEVRELALGLEASGQPFLWERVQGRWLIVRDWAPQLEIPRHPSTGGFFTHCGWNSCMESFTMGVPMVAWPMHSDQPVNLQLLTGVLGVGLAVKEWHERDDILMVSEEGAEMRRKAAELRDAARKAVSKGGMSCAAFDSFLELISQP